jgi:zinc transporter 1
LELLRINSITKRVLRSSEEDHRVEGQDGSQQDQAHPGAVGYRHRLLLPRAYRWYDFQAEVLILSLADKTTGYAVHSLALVADAFHMLNDVLSLCVGLWAVRIANSGSSKMYTYGWQRAETLGALVNGVFLVALCLSIFLEAIQRFVEPQIVSNPKLVMIVGCFGLASNIMGLFLFHEHGHGHSHGREEEGHSHSHDPVSNAEEGHSHGHDHSVDADTARMTDEAGNIEDILPQIRVGGFSSVARDRAHSPKFTKSDESEPTVSSRSPRTPGRKSVASNSEIHGRHRRRTSGSYSRGFGSVDNIHIHPASFRNEIINAARQEEIINESDPDEEEALLDVEGPGDTPDRHAYHSFSNGSPKKSNGNAGYGTLRKQSTDDYDHTSHNHRQPKEQSSGGGHGHSHGDLNMRGVFLHVMGDALGNIGVIGSALFIWLTNYSWRYYVDPGISLLITVIILTSAIPLCRAASRILLQAVPVGMSIDDIKEDIQGLKRVIECHHLHVWQLSDTKLIASLHVKVDCEVEGTGSASYMHLAREIRHCLHEYGIHSSTIQPEFCSPASEADSSPTAVGSSSLSPKTGANGKVSKAGSLTSNDRSCLLDCQDECGSKGQCCPPDDAKK